jgi:hypothetical protein
MNERLDWVDLFVGLAIAAALFSGFYLIVGVFFN